MNRRTILAAFGATPTALAGCVSDGSTNGRDGGDSDRSRGGSVLERFDGEPDRPECERESETIETERNGETNEWETAATLPYPDSPASVTETDVVEFVEEFDHAYVTHDTLCDGGSGHVLSVSHSVRESDTFDWYEDIAVVYLLRSAGASGGVDHEGREWAADLGYSGVVYAVDETGAARAGYEAARSLEGGEIESQAPDPLEEGTLVAAFD